MFASLKNKIREETGNDFSKLTSKITSSTVQKIENLRTRSHQGSTSSLNSALSTDDHPIEHEEYKRRIAEIYKRLDQKEHEWKEILNDKDKQLQKVEREKDEAYKQIATLKDALNNAEETNHKMLEHRDNVEQIETFQSQELVKIKQLVLQRDKELSNKTAALKEATNQLEKLKKEITRLQRQEELLSDMQDDLEALRHSSARDLTRLSTELAKTEQERKHLSDLVDILRKSNLNENVTDENVINERKLLEQRLEEAHLQLADIKTSWSDKITSLETQVGRLSRQAAEEGAERRRAIDERDKLLEKVEQLESELDTYKSELEIKDMKIKRLTEDVNEVSSELKVLQQENDEEIQFLRTELDNSNTEVKVVKKNLDNVESEKGKLEDSNNKLKVSIDLEQLTNNSLRQIISKLETELTEERSNSLNVQKTLTRVTTEKNTALIRNAEISQQMELVKQNMRRQESEMNDVLQKLNNVEQENRKLKETEFVEQSLNSTIIELEEQLLEKNKTIKILQLRLTDLKKTLQHELQAPVGTTTSSKSLSDISLDDSPAILQPSQITNETLPNIVKRNDEDVNFKYLKHVVLKFLTCREYEAQHLIKAISTLLKFTLEEEKLIQDTLEWKMSWFGSKPKLVKPINFNS